MKFNNKLDAKGRKFVKAYYGRMMRDVGIGLVSGLAVYYFTTKHLSIDTGWLLIGVAFFMIAIGEMIVYSDSMKK
jgi:uncharacterized membrane protein (Fun14 family)